MIGEVKIFMENLSLQKGLSLVVSIHYLSKKINWQTSFSAHDQKSWYGLINYNAT